MAHFGYANNNPGNIRWNERDKWQGLSVQPRFVPGWDKTGIGFFRFSVPEWGIRAVIKTLRTYQTKYGDRTLVQMFHRYAPFGDHANNPDAYAAFLSKQIGLDPNAEPDLFDQETVTHLLKAIFLIETGEPPPYEKAVYEKAYALAA